MRIKGERLPEGVDLGSRRPSRGPWSRRNLRGVAATGSVTETSRCEARSGRAARRRQTASPVPSRRLPPGPLGPVVREVAPGRRVERRQPRPPHVVPERRQVFADRPHRRVRTPFPVDPDRQAPRQMPPDVRDARSQLAADRQHERPWPARGNGERLRRCLADGHPDRVPGRRRHLEHPPLRLAERPPPHVLAVDPVRHPAPVPRIRLRLQRTRLLFSPSRKTRTGARRCRTARQASTAP